MKKQNGITLVSLVITIIVLIILASIATYSGIDVIRASKFTAFSTELKIMQTYVNEQYDIDMDAEYGAEIIGDIKIQADIAFKASGITNKEGYRYWDKETIKKLGIEGVEQEFFVNLKKRSIISYQGLEYDGKKYYTLEQIPRGLYNVEYKVKNNEPEFQTKIEYISTNKWRITVYDIECDGYINKWQIKYRKENGQYWNTSEDLSFVVNESGSYQIQIQNGAVKSKLKNITLEITQ